MTARESLIDPAPAVEAFLAAGGRAVAFDVFDTLLWRRTLFPADAFALLPHGRFGNALRPRVEAVVTAVCRRLLRREPRLDDIYRGYYPFDRTAELQLEARLAVANPYCLVLVRRLIERRVPVVAVSDMYLSGAQIAALLEAAGYPALPVLSSADAGVSKRVDGRLFALAVQTLGLPPAQVLHVGDDWHADVAMARSQGLASLRLRPPRETLLELHPELARVRPRGEEALFWGELALALHSHPGLAAHDSAVLKDDLARLLRQPGTRQQAPQALVDALFQRREAGS